MGPALVLSLAVFTGAASMRCLDALLPAISQQFGESIGSTGASVAAYALSYSLGQLFYGPMGDRFGPFRMITWAVCLSAVAATACVFATSLTSLVSLRFIAGAIAAAIGPLTLTWLSRFTTAAERPVAFARMTAAAIIGSAAGQAGGGVIGGLFEWPFVFALLAALFGTTGVALIFTARSSPRVLGPRYSEIARKSYRFGSFSLLRRAPVAIVLALVAVEGLSLYLSLTFVGALLKERLALESTRSGLLLSCFGIGGVAFVALARRLIDRSTSGLRALTSGIVLGLGFVGLACSNSQFVMAGCLFAIGFGFLMLHNLLQVMAAEMAPDELGTAFSLFAAVSCLSQAAGATVGGFLFDHTGVTFSCLLSGTILTTLGFSIWAKQTVIRRSLPL